MPGGPFFNCYPGPFSNVRCTWDIADYDETTQSFSFRQDEVEEAINNAVSLRAEFTEA